MREPATARAAVVLLPPRSGGDWLALGFIGTGAGRVVTFRSIAAAGGPAALAAGSGATTELWSGACVPAEHPAPTERISNQTSRAIAAAGLEARKCSTLARNWIMRASRSQGPLL